MTDDKTQLPPATRGAPLRARVLDAAENLLRAGEAEFSMRDLATQAGVSFATPFNQFGSKAAILQALSARRIDTMEARFAATPALADAPGRVLLATDIAVAVMLEQPDVNRVVMGWLGTATGAPGQILARSTALWTLALGSGEGLIPARRDEAIHTLPPLLAFAFRGVLSFWTAGEVPDAALGRGARRLARNLLFCFSERPSLDDFER